MRSWFFLLLTLGLINIAYGQSQRIISLAPNVTEMLYDIGAGDDVVAVDRDSDYPVSVKTLPKVDGYTSNSVEAILALNPTLVIGWQGGNSPQLIQSLQRLGVNVLLVNTLTLADIGKTLQQLGAATNHIQSAYQAAEKFQQQLTQLSQRYAQQPSHRTVMIELSDHPLYVATANSLQSQVIQLCGGVNAFQALPGEAQMVSVESVLQANPQVIIAVTPLSLNDWSQWPELPAVQSKRMAVIDADLLSRNDPRILQGARQVCEVVAQAK